MMVQVKPAASAATSFIINASLLPVENVIAKYDSVANMQLCTESPFWLNVARHGYAAGCEARLCLAVT
jgi:hypothetical protein